MKLDIDIEVLLNDIDYLLGFIILPQKLTIEEMPKMQEIMDRLEKYRELQRQRA